MIRHIVVFRFGPGTPEDQRAKFVALSSALRPLASTVPGVRSLRVDADPKKVPSHWDAALVSEHDTWQALEAYQVDPAHVAAVEVVNSVVVDRAVLDYEL